VFIPCGRLSWVPVSYLLYVKYTLSYRIVSLGKNYLFISKQEIGRGLLLPCDALYSRAVYATAILSVCPSIVCPSEINVKTAEWIELLLFLNVKLFINTQSVAHYML